MIMNNSIELFCGLKSWTKEAKKYNYRCMTHDIDKKFNPTLCKDILLTKLNHFPIRFRKPNVLWASPPYTFFFQ